MMHFNTVSVFQHGIDWPRVTVENIFLRYFEVGLNLKSCGCKAKPLNHTAILLNMKKQLHIVLKKIF